MCVSTDQQLDRLQDRLQYRFADVALLRQAMVHRSYLNEAAEANLQSNERLEFLGDAVLDSVVAHWLYTEFPTASEGWMTAARSQLVRNRTLSEIGRALGLGEFVLLGAGIANDGGRQSPRVLSHALEATFGAIWLDGGETAVRRVILRLLLPYMEELTAAETPANSKSQLQEQLQSRSGTQPSYAIIAESGPPHDRSFRAIVEVEGRTLAEGEGRSKQAAEMDAARRALASLQTETA